MNTIVENDKQYIEQTYKRQNLAIAKAKGKYVYDELVAFDRYTCLDAFGRLRYVEDGGDDKCE